MVDNKKYFLLATIFSFLIFSFFLGSLFYIIGYQDKIITYGQTKKKYISIALTTPPKTQKKKSIKKKKIHKKKSPVVKKKPKKAVVDPVEDLSVDDLFNDVWTKKVIPQKKPKTDQKKIAQIQETLSYEIDITPSKIVKKQEQPTKKESTALAVNKYLATIHAIVYDHFFPPQNTQGLSVEVVLELSALGKMLDFRVLRYSNSQILNEEVDSIKQRLVGVIFPKNPQNQPAQVRIILKPQDKE